MVAVVLDPTDVLVSTVLLGHSAREVSHPKFIFSQVLIVLTSVKMCGLFTVSGLLQECGNTVSM